MNFTDFKKKILSDPEVKKEYDLLEPEYQVIREVIQSRLESNITQQELADKTGINRSDLSKLENGNANPSLKTLKRIAEGLGKHLEIKFL